MQNFNHIMQPATRSLGKLFLSALFLSCLMLMPQTISAETSIKGTLYDGANTDITIDAIDINYDDLSESFYNPEYYNIFKYVATCTGTLTVTSVSGEHAYGILVDADTNEVLADDFYTLMNGGDFEISYNVTKGKTYYIGIREPNNETISNFAITITSEWVLTDGENTVDVAGVDSDSFMSASDYILYKYTATGTGTLTITLNDENDADIYGHLFNADKNLLDVELTSGHDHDHEFIYEVTEGTTYYVGVRATKPNTVLSNFSINVSGDWNEVAEDNSNNATTGIEDIKAESSNGEAAIFDLNGRRLQKLTRGVNIVRQADGTTTKVIVK